MISKVQITVLNFFTLVSTGRDSATFWDNGTEVPSFSRDKGTTRQAKNLAKGRDETGQPKFGTGQPKFRDGTGPDSQNTGRHVGQSGTEQKRTF